MTNTLLAFNPAAATLSRWFDLEEEDGFHPACDLEETEAAYVFAFDLPGLTKDDVKIEIIGDRLTLSGGRKLERSEGKSNRHLAERLHGSFTRSFTLPEAIDASKVEAEFKDGVLRIEVAKPEAVRPFEVKIKTGDDKAS